MEFGLGKEMDIEQYFEDASKTFLEMKGQSDLIGDIASTLIKSLRNGGTIFWCGNGGSASDAQHLAAELIGRFRLNRAPLRSIALNTDTSIMTATANDFGYENVFSRQISALGREGDVLVGISTSGKSPSIVKALEEARLKKLTTILFTGPFEVPSNIDCDLYLRVPNEQTSHIQEAHIATGQLICGIVENYFFENNAD
jgi:D-sedoheptulose 7-phosphate isomerase